MPDAGFSTSLEEMDAGISINNTVSGFPEIQDATPLFDCSVVPAGQPQLRSLTAHQQARLRSGDGSARPRVLNASAWPGASGRYALLVFMPDAVCGGGRRRHRRRYRCGDHLAQVFAELLGGAMASDGFHIVAPEPSGQYAAHAITGHCAAPACIQRRGSDLRPRHAHQGHEPGGNLGYPLALKVEGGPADRDGAKVQVVHLIGAAGTMASLLCACARGKGVISPTINYSSPHPEWDLDYVPKNARQQDVRYAVTNAFGSGGQNCVVAFEPV